MIKEESPIKFDRAFVFGDETIRICLSICLSSFWF